MNFLQLKYTNGIISDLEELTLKLLGIKNKNPSELQNTSIPEEIFTENLKPREIEKVISLRVMVLSHATSHRASSYGGVRT